VHVLRAEADGGAVEFVGGAFKAGEGRAYHDLDIVLLADLGDDIGHEGDAVSGGFIHFPITSDEFFAEGHSL